MRRGLTPKQERFCNLYLETGNASEAYRRAYDCADRSAEWLAVNSCKLLKNANVALRVSELQARQRDKCEITRDEIVRLCADVIRGKEVADFVEERNGRKFRRNLSKSWAVERLCKMLGFDAPAKQDVTLTQAADFIDLSMVPDDVICEMADKLLDYRDKALEEAAEQSD